MKKFTLFICILCLVKVSNAQTSIPVKRDGINRNNIPDHIRNRKAFKRAEWFFTQRAFPYDTLPAMKYSRDVVREIQKTKYKKVTGNNSQSWSSVGPKGINTANTYFSHWGTFAGRVRAIAVHPTDPLTVYIGAASGGLWKTTDGGANWQDIGHNLGSVTFGAIAIDPNNPEIVYAGSGECNLMPTYAYSGNGLYKSMDGGQTWNVITDGFGPVTYFGDLLVSPYNSNVIIAALGGASMFSGAVLSNEGIWKSIDGGITWNRILEVQDASDIAFHPTDPNKVYASAGGYLSILSGFYISSDQGATWIQSNTGLMLPSSGGRMQFDISRSHPSIIYAVIYDFNNDINQSITRAYKSVNGGNSWTHISNGINLGGYDGYSWYDQGWYDLCIAVDPVNPSHVLIGNVELHRTMNGAIFSPVRQFGNNCNGSLVHVDYHKLVFAPSDPNYLYIGCDGGLYKSTDKGYTATSQNQGLETLQFYRIGSHPDSSGIFMGGMQDNGSALTHDGGESWNFVNAEDGMECIFDYVNPNVIYNTTYAGMVYKSVNGGNSFSPLRLFNGAWITPFFMHPTDNNTLYAATKNIYKSTNGGGAFLVVAADVAPVNINTMAQSPVNPSHMIFGTGVDVFIWDTLFLVKISTDEGISWTDVTTNIPGEARWISRVATDPVDAATMYVLRTGFSEGNKVWKTTDLGQTWTNISGDLPDLPCSDLFIDPENTQHLYLANDIGVYRTTDGGISWTYASEGMPLVPAMDFDYVNIDTTRYLRVGTHGRSIYQTILPNFCPAGNQVFTSQAQVDQFKLAYPLCNEIHGSITIKGDDITNLDGLNGIIRIRGELRIDSCATLSNLSGLSNLANIGGDLIILSNDILDSLSGLDYIAAASIANLAIANNPLLSACEVQSVCEYLLAPTGTTDIHDNATRCNSPQELEVVCQHVGVENELAAEELVIIPNPSSGRFTIYFTLLDQAQTSFVVFNNLGQTVAILAEGQLTPGRHQLIWNAEGLPAGIYYCRLQSGKQVMTNKIIKMQ